jgi:hypothetical protein
MQQSIEISQVFEAMWQDYLELNPDALKIYQLFSKKNTVVNDHVAFRTFGIDGIRVEDLAAPLIAAGYKEAGSYDFPEKKLRAKHYAHPEQPLVFISELIVEVFSAQAQAIISDLVEQMDLSRVSRSDFLYSGQHWQMSSSEYETLLIESEYAAWVAAFGFRANHFTVSINHLEQFSDIHQVNQFLLDNHFVMNQSGGIVKGTPEVYLEQSSTMANRVEVTFSDKTALVPSCFYEFAIRHKMENGELFKGFIASSADKIFESTNRIAA